MIVFLGDMSKGALAVLVAESVGIKGPWLLLPAFAALAGHWRSVFTGFRGGDGLATLGGSTIALFPVLGLASVAVAALVAIGALRMPFTTLLCIVVGYAALVAFTIAYKGDTVLAVGCGGLGGLVLTHAIVGHWRRRHASEWRREPGDTEGVTERSGLR